jgi:hypothetical protein
MEMPMLCRQYISLAKTGGLDAKGIWTRASLEVAEMTGHTIKASKKPGRRRAEDLRKWVRDFIRDREEVPICQWKTTGRSLIDDEDFAQEIHAHLQSLRPEDRIAEAIVRFLDNEEMLQRLHRKKTISMATAMRWMLKMGYRWSYDPKGQYVDGHERDDVVKHRNEVFLPALAQLSHQRLVFASKDGPNTEPSELECRVIAWYHDKSTFYAHNRQRKCWVHCSEKTVPYQKGEGASLMVADFVSAEYGWLCLADGTKHT